MANVNLAGTLYATRMQHLQQQAALQQQKQQQEQEFALRQQDQNKLDLQQALDMLIRAQTSAHDRELATAELIGKSTASQGKTAPQEATPAAERMSQAGQAQGEVLYRDWANEMSRKEAESKFSREKFDEVNRQWGVKTTETGRSHRANEAIGRLNAMKVRQSSGNYGPMVSSVDRYYGKLIDTKKAELTKLVDPLGGKIAPEDELEVTRLRGEIEDLAIAWDGERVRMQNMGLGTGSRSSSSGIPPPDRPDPAVNLEDLFGQSVKQKPGKAGPPTSSDRDSKARKLLGLE